MLSLDERPGLFSPHYSTVKVSPYAPMAKPTEEVEKATRTTRHMWIVTGPAGCGKSTVAKFLAKQLSIPFVEGDDVSTRRCAPLPWEQRLYILLEAYGLMNSSFTHQQTARKWKPARLSTTKTAGTGW